MKWLAIAFRHPAALAFALLLGAVAGHFAPSTGSSLDAVGKVYISIINMAAVPLIVVAVFFGLRRLILLPFAGVRLGALLGTGLLALVLSALVSAAVSQLWGAGTNLGEAGATALGRLSLESEAYTSVSLFGQDKPADRDWVRVIPDNLYNALAFGSMPAVLVGALFFGFALAVQGQDSARAFHHLMEATYRGLEVLIERLNVVLPVIAFAFAANVFSVTDLNWMGLMSGFLVPFMFMCAVFVGACSLAAARYLDVGFWRVLNDLRRPYIVALFSGGTAAAVPGFIDAMCNQLGFRRDLVEFSAPVIPVFLRMGDAVFFAVLAVFVANLCGRPPGAADLALIALASAAAALASTAVVGGRSLVTAVLLLGWLDLPAEGILPAFVLLELLCEGLRNVLSLAMTCALVTLASRGLASEAPELASAQAGAEEPRIRIVVRRSQAFAMGLLIALALGTACLAGIGLGLRQGSGAAVLMTKGAP
jgi:Na+/H+-dicarboxylate symporter